MMSVTDKEQELAKVRAEIAALEAGENRDQDPKTPHRSLRERLDIKPEDFNEFSKLVYGEIKPHKKRVINKDETPAQRLRNEDIGEDIQTLAQNVATLAAPYHGVKALGQLANKGIEAAKNIPSRVRSVMDRSKLSRLKYNPELKERVIERLGNQAGGRNIRKANASKTGDITREAVELYKKRYTKASAKAYEKPRKAMEEFTENHSNDKRFTQISPVLKPLIEHYKGIEEPALKTSFLQSNAGKRLIVGLGGTDNIKVPKTKRPTLVQKVDALISNPDIVEGRVMPIKGAEAFKEEIGDLLQSKELFGTSDERKLSHAYHTIKEMIAGKYAEVSPEALALLKEAEALVKHHHKTKAPHANAIASHPQENRADTFLESLKGIDGDARATRFVSENLRKSKRKGYHRGIIMALGKKGDKFNPTTFDKSFADLPAESKSFTLRHLGAEDKKNVGALLKRLKTVNSAEAKVNPVAEVMKSFVPSKWEKAVTRPVRTLRQNNYLSPKQVIKVTEAVKRKAHPTFRKKSSFDNKGYAALAGMSRRNHDSTSEYHDHLSSKEAELAEVRRQIAELS